MVVMFGHEKHFIDDAHGFVQSGMQSCFAQIVLGQRLESMHQSASGGAKIPKHILDRSGIVIGKIGCRICQIGGSKRVRTREQVLKPSAPQRLEVKQMTNVFLDRPMVIRPCNQVLTWDGSDPFFQACWRSSQAFEYAREHPCGKVHWECSFKPFHVVFHWCFAVYRFGRGLLHPCQHVQAASNGAT